MRSKFIVAIVVVLSGSTAVLAQTKISGTLQCKVGEHHELEVGDRPNHSLSIGKQICTWPKPIEIAGTQSKEMIGTGSMEASGTKGRARVYGTITWANGDKSYCDMQGSGILNESAEGTWKFTGGPAS
jgi:hypothetical protein